MTIHVEGLCPLLQVFDMPTSLAFYRDVLGFRVEQAAPSGERCDWCLLRLGDTELMLNTQYEQHERPPHPNAARSIGHGDVALYFRCADLDGAYAHLESRGVDVDPPIVRDYGMRQVYCRDPDGYVLCLQAPI